MSVLFTFPGQGAQRPGMLSRLPDTPQTRETLTEAGDILLQDPRELDTAEALRSTLAVQPCLLIAGVAMARTLIARDAVPDMVTGMSIGAFPAAVIAGALDYGDALRLVARRAHLMAEAFPRDHGMTAIWGMDLPVLASIVAQLQSDGLAVHIGNVNAEHQLVITGSDTGMAAAVELAMIHGASRFQRLDVSVPSHCPLLAPVAQALRAAATSIRFRKPLRRYLSASSARSLVDPARIADDLASNVANRVNWPDTIELAWELGSRLAVEMPGGQVLSRLSRPPFPAGQAISVEAVPLGNIEHLIRSRRQDIADFPQ